MLLLTFKAESLYDQWLQLQGEELIAETMSTLLTTGKQYPVSIDAHYQVWCKLFHLDLNNQLDGLGMVQVNKDTYYDATTGEMWMRNDKNGGLILYRLMTNLGYTSTTTSPFK